MFFEIQTRQILNNFMLFFTFLHKIHPSDFKHINFVSYIHLKIKQFNNTYKTLYKN